MAGTLANAGTNPITGKQVLDPDYVPEVLAVMATAGLYDDSGKWLYRTGLPAKSGVGGGIMAVLPGQFGLGVFSPALDGKGNSVRDLCHRVKTSIPCSRCPCKDESPASH